MFQGNRLRGSEEEKAVFFFKFSPYTDMANIWQFM